DGRRPRAAARRCSTPRAARRLRRTQADRQVCVADLVLRLGDRRARLLDAVAPRARVAPYHLIAVCHRPRAEGPDAEAHAPSRSSSFAGPAGTVTLPLAVPRWASTSQCAVTWIHARNELPDQLVCQAPANASITRDEHRSTNAMDDAVID